MSTPDARGIPVSGAVGRPRPGLAGRSPLRDGLVLAGLIVAAWMYAVVGDATWKSPGADALVYWSVDPSAPYAGATVGGADAYLYSPAFAQAFAILRVLPREAFVVAWTVVLAAVALWLAEPWPAALLVLALPVSQEVLIGNIHLLLAAAIVIGLRYPAAWAFVLLTKVTPGIGLLWFVVRREWRQLAVALLVTLAIAAGSFVLAPQLWLDWLGVLRHDGGQESWRLYVRLVAAAAVVVWGARTNRAWTVPFAGLVALPVIWSDSFSMLLGCVALARSGTPSTPRTR